MGLDLGRNKSTQRQGAKVSAVYFIVVLSVLIRICSVGGSPEERPSAHCYYSHHYGTVDHLLHTVRLCGCGTLHNMGLKTSEDGWRVVELNKHSITANGCGHADYIYMQGILLF